MRAGHVLLAMMLSLLPALANALPGEGAAWEVSDDVTIEGAPLALATDVIVLSGGALRLKGVDVVALSAPARGINITVRAGGELVLEDGASVATSATRPTTLTGSAPVDIYVEDGGILRATNATLTQARLHLASSGAELQDVTVASGAVRILHGSPRIRGGALDGSTGALLDALGGSALVEGARFDHAGGPAIFVRAAASLRAMNVTIGQTGDYGMRVEGGTIVVQNASFTLSPSYAFYGVGANVTLRDSTFRTHCGAFLIGGTHGIVQGNDFGTLDHGVTLSGTGPLAVQDNTFHGTQVALLTIGATPLVRNNSFTDNAVAVQNMGPATLDARWNWWGDAAGPGAGATVGSVDVAPWLMSGS